MNLICLIPDQHHLAKQLADTSARAYFIILLYLYVFIISDSLFSNKKNIITTISTKESIHF